MGKSQELYIKAKKLIPGGTQLLSKRPEMFLPGGWPAYYSRAKGCNVWDLDGIEYIDVSYMGIGANVLGYADDDVNEAAKDAIDRSSMCTLNAPEEVELATVLIEMNPWANEVRYAKTGGEAMAIAVRIARAFTGKDKILFCGYHGWSDWYLAANLSEDSALDGHLLKGLNPKGVPRGLTGTSIPFNYNNIEEFKFLVKKHIGEIAAIVMEPIRNNYPENCFLEEIRKITEDVNIPLIFDEITSGFRLNCGGAHRILNVAPDIAVFGKAISNGFPMAAIVGKRDIMEASQESFISSTYWTDRIGLAASIACIRKFKEKSVEKHLDYIGQLVKDGWERCAEIAGIDVCVSGINPLAHFEFVYNNKLELKTLFTQEMLKRGYLATTAFYVSFAHSEEIIKKYLDNVEDVFMQIKKAIDNDTANSIIDGDVCHSGFQRLL
jgi:glutamate-1-semialdehyde aminotransferase